MRSHKSKVAALVLLLVLNVSAMAGPRIVADPVADFIRRHCRDLRSAEQKNEHVLKFEVDVDGDGMPDVFLSSEKSLLLSGGDYENDVHSWDFYKNLGGGNYSVIDQEKVTVGGDTYSHASAFLFDPAKLYVGPISEVGGNGLLAMYYVPRQNGAFVSAYIVTSDLFEIKNFPDPVSVQPQVYNRDDNGGIPDFPDACKHYFATPPAQSVTILSQTY